ncbi:class I fructose-bisphosphate aldolase [Humidisolicoccus flavus]|uniref:class I fructose-bisphosphate aldolase n=1 Tax=Humidisolicoccus flavus TaxID=3111414 RepID=UPI003244247D
MKRKMHRLFREDGRIMIVAMDHTNFLDAPVPGLVDYEGTVRATVRAGADAFLSPIGSTERYPDAFGGSAIITSVDTAHPFGAEAIGRALAAGSDAVKAMVYPFGDDDSVNRSAALAAQAAAVGLPYLAEPIPGGFSRADMRTPEIIAAGARVAAESGADFVKTFYTGDPQTMKIVVDYASVPVIILGGHQKETLGELFQEIHDAINIAGVAGVAIGTNIWTSKNPGGVVAGLTAILHEGATAEQAISAAEGWTP